jgi:IS30 family transposase
MNGLPLSIQEKFGYWEADTVVGKRQGKEAVVFTMVERITSLYRY